MATYAIGDVQGCYDELRELLDKICFNENKDVLWLTGDLVNRGPKSLQVLRFVHQLPQKIVVLGNHDFYLLSLAEGIRFNGDHQLHDVLNAPDREELIHFLKHCPLLYYDDKLNYVMVHAGLAPQWDLTLARQCAKEVFDVLQSEEAHHFLLSLYGDWPNQWQEGLQGIERLRFIVNALTRIRFCNEAGVLEFDQKGKIGSQQPNWVPWFKIPWRRNKDLRIIFGHWAALQGKTDEPNVFALDTGCVWGGELTAMRLEDGQRFSDLSKMKKL